MKIGKYYVTHNGNPYFNMAFDEWLFEKLKSDEDVCPAYLRLYSWRSNAITIGYNQNIEKALSLDLLDKHIPIIRRKTGGRAIYHDPSELTYTVILNTDYLPSESKPLKETNRLISEAIVALFEHVGIESEWAKQSDLNFISPHNEVRKACFGSLSRFEITSGAEKIAAGAQRRVGNRLIHQGSLKINGITECSAINQKSHAPSLIKNSTKKQTPIFKIDDLFVVFCDFISRKLSFNFQLNQLNTLEMAEIDDFMLVFQEKALDKR